MKNEVILTTNLNGIELLKRGKVRDIYKVDDCLLIVSTDRISCFDVVLPTGIPEKGIVLNKLSVFWFNYTNNIVRNHFITANIQEYPDVLKKFNDIIENRSMLVKKAKPIPVECVVRGYLAGSAWEEYKTSQEVCGIKLPSGLVNFSKLPEPIFTPATKEEKGHDINVTYSYIKNLIGSETANKIKDLSLMLYDKVSKYTEEKGIIIADTKFEFGFLDDEIILIDEVLTPDSSRFWSKEDYTQSNKPENFDKQFVRDYLENLGWDKNPPAPELPEYIVKRTAEKYLQILSYLLT